MSVPEAARLITALDQLQSLAQAQKLRGRKRCRRVETHNAEDGMAWLTAYAPAEELRAAYHRIDTLARDLGTEDERFMDQRRADVMIELLLGNLQTSVTTHVYVTARAETLLGLDNLPGDLRRQRRTPRPPPRTPPPRRRRATTETTGAITRRISAAPRKTAARRPALLTTPSGPDSSKLRNSAAYSDDY